MAFIEAIDGNYYGVGSIMKIVPPAALDENLSKRLIQEAQVVLNTGTKVGVEYGRLLTLLDQPTHFIAARPDTAMLSFDAEQDHVFHNTVIAWAYTVKGDVLPVTSAGVGYTRRSDAVRHPNGLVDNELDGWPNEDAWRAWAIGEASYEVEPDGS